MDQGIYKPDVAFVNLTLNWKIWEAVHQEAMEKERVLNLKLRKQRKLLIFLKPSRKTSSSNLSSDVAPKGLDTNTQFNSYVQPTALANFEIGDKLCTEIRWTLTHLKACFLTVKLLRKWNWVPIS